MTSIGPESIRQLLPDEVLQLEELSILNQLEFLQNMEVNSEKAEKISQLQEQFVEQALTEGFLNLDTESDNPKEEGLKKNILNLFQTCAKFVREKDMEETVHFSAMVVGISLARQDIHFDKDITDHQKLFYEFLAGLAAFQLAVEMSRHTTLKLLTDEDPRREVLEAMKPPETEDFREILLYCSNLAKLTGDIIVSDYSGNAEEYWQKHDAIVSEDVFLRSTAEQLVCLHHVPIHDSAHMLAIAQVLHWYGFGGRGEFLNKIGESHPELSFLTELSQHSLGFFGAQQKIAQGEDHNFYSRLTLFGQILAPMRQHADQQAAAFLQSQFPDQKEFTIFEDAAGPIGLVSSTLTKALIADQPDVQVKAILADVAGPSLVNTTAIQTSLQEFHAGNESMRDTLPANIQDIADNFSIENVAYRNIGQNSTGTLEAKYADKVDGYILALGLHQVADHQRGDSRVAHTLQNATKMVKVGGSINLQLVLGKGDRQFSVIPANLVDREGTIAANFYRLHLPSVRDYAVETSDGKFKVPVPRTETFIATPQSIVDEDGNAIYGYQLYEIVEVEEYELDVIDQMRREGRISEIRSALAQSGSEIDELRGGYSHRLEV